MSDMKSRRELLSLSGAAAIGLAVGCATSATGDGVNLGTVAQKVCELYRDIKAHYPGLKQWAVDHRSLFAADMWDSLVKFDDRTDEIGAILESACSVPLTTSTASKWERAAAVVVQVAQIGFKVATVAGVI